MLTLLSALVGFLTSTFPAAVKIFEKRQDYKHELELRRLEIEAAAQGIALQARLEQIKALIEQNRAIYAHDESLVGSNFINNLRASVRPIITYTFFGLFCVIKIAFCGIGIYYGYPIDKLLGLIWDDYTASMFGAIMGFWFGSRFWDKDYDRTVILKQSEDPPKPKSISTTK